jgi:hypothetical protein
MDVDNSSNRIALIIARTTGESREVIEQQTGQLQPWGVLVRALRDALPLPQDLERDSIAHSEHSFKVV